MSVPGRRGTHPRQAWRRGGRQARRQAYLLAGLLAAAAAVAGGAEGLGAEQAGSAPVLPQVPRELSLEQAVSLAMQQAGALKLERRSVERSSLALREARAGLGPQLSLSVAAAYLTNPPSITVPAGSLGETGPPILPVTLRFPEEDREFSEITGNTYFELSLELKQPVFTWLKLRNAVDLAGLGVEVSVAEMEEARRRIRRETAESYYAALLARESRVHLASMVAVFGEIEADRSEAYDLGLINLRELLDARAQAAEAGHSLLEAEEGLLTALQALEFYTGLAVEAPELSSDFATAGTGPQEEILKRQSLHRSPVLKKARLQVEQARKNAARLRGAGILKPDFALSVAVDVSGQKPPWAGEGWEGSWDANVTIGVGAEGSLFDSGRSRWAVAQAEESARSAEEALQLGTRQIELAVRRAVQEARVAQGRIAAAEALLRAGREAEANARVAFTQELLTRQQLGGARLERLLGEIELLRARHDAAVAAVRLEYLAGESPQALGPTGWWAR